ncbi:helix-turn-helix domain-containing protein [Paenibacillus periandrae]|uniref:helix-turn-helix domain-containing protein n=1 Tax=Paenibacillus periandrae TaxID=1761741 RepID=UPI001F08F7EB|nr:helix-turn-helix transcriptional regulator [Paenibacillus periandrae]
MPERILKNIGARVRDIRKEKGYSQEQLGELANFHFSYIGAVERGEKNITMSNLAKVAAALDVEVIELFRYSNIDLGETSKQKDLQEIVDLLLRHPKEDIRKAKVILKEIFG